MKSSCDVARVGIRSVSSVHRFVYDRTDLLRLCPLHFDVCAWNRPRNWKYRAERAGGVLPRKYRGSRAGELIQEKRMHYSYNIQTLVSHPSSRSSFAYSRSTSNCSNHSNLTIIPCKPRESRYTPVVCPARFCLINARSVYNKTLLVKDLVIEHCIDLLAVTETWLQ